MPARDWPFGSLTLSQEARRGTVTLTVYPALRRAGASVEPHEFLSLAEARHAHANAILKLLRLRFPQQIKAMRKLLLAARELQLLWAAYDDPGGAVLVDDFVDGALRMSFEQAFDGVRDRDAWLSLCESGADRMMPCAESLRSFLLEILQANAALRERLAHAPEHFAEARDDVSQQAAALVYPGFIADTPVERLPDIARFITAAALRLERIASNPARDTESQAMIASLRSRLDAFGVAIPGPNQRAALDVFRWQIEELRVSLFAQSLGTREKVSLKRLEKRWDEILRISD